MGTSEEIKILVQKHVTQTNANAANNNQQLVENGVASSNGSYKFVGQKSRTREQLQSLMYCEEMEQWLAEERLEEARTQARLALLLRADSHGSGDADQITTDAVQVVEDEDEVTTIRRPVLPDVKFA